MEETNDSGFSLASLDFIFRHPWVILFSFLIIFNIFHAYAVSIPPEYRANAALSFEAAPGTLNDPNAINEKRDAAEKVLTGQNIDLILEDALRDETAAERPVQYSRLAARLSKPKTGMSFTWAGKGTSHLLSIGFSYSNARLCHNVVKAAMEMIIRESEQKVTRQLQANMAFLRDQQKFYKGKLDAIDREIEAIKDELVRRFPELTDEEKELIAKSSSDVDITKKGSVQKLAMQEETVSKLKMSLAELEQKREKLQGSLESGTFMTQYSLDDLSKQDQIMGEYSKTVSAKELEISSLIARGYKDEHPLVKQLRQEIEQLKEMRQKRIGRLRTGGPGTPEYEEAREKARLEIEELDLRIAFMKDSLKAADESRKIATKQLKERPAKGSDIKERVSRLMILKSERDINDGYYLDMKKKLADAELRSRTEKEDLGFKIEVVQEPVVPTRPNSARTLSIVFRGGMLGLFLGAGIAYLIDKLKNGIRSDRELAEMLGVPVLATIDRIATPQEVASQRRRLKYAAIGTVVAMVVSRLVIGVLFSVKT